MNMIVATDLNNGIGFNGDLLFRIPEDLKMFKKLTTGHIVVMGSKTFESIGKPLPNRTNIVLTSTPLKYQNTGVEAYCKEDLDRVLKNEESDDIFIIGGESLYKSYINECDVIYKTLYFTRFMANRFFPEMDYTKYDAEIIGGGMYEDKPFEIDKYIRK